MGNVYKPTLKSGGESRLYWISYYNGGKRVRESAGTESMKEAKKLLALRESGQPYPGNRSPRNEAERWLGPPAAILPANVVRGALVYAWIAEDKTVKYVGMSRIGIERPAAVRHNAARAIVPTDRLYVWTFETAKQAAEAEAALITRLAPSVNKQINPSTLMEVSA
jgi:hypothetical protein